MAISVDTQFYKGEDIVFTVTMTPVTNITGWNIQATIRKAFGDPQTLVKKTVGAGITLTDPTNGVFQVVIDSGDTDDLAPGVYVYDIQRTDTGQRAVLTIGNLTLLPEVALLV